MNKALIGIHVWAIAGGIVLYILLWGLEITDLNTFTIITYLVFYLIALFTVLFAFLTYNNPNKALFGNVALVMMMLKLIITPFIIIWYIKSNEEISRWILLPFFFSYLWFTVYEMYFLMKKGEDGIVEP